VCQHIQAAGAAPPPPPAPALAPAANRARYASGGQPAYQGQTTASVLPGDSSMTPARGIDRTPPASQMDSPGQPGIHGLRDAGAASAAQVVDGCGVCGSSDVQYVLETDVGVDAATLAAGNIVRAAFCSVECLAEKLGLARVAPPG
jgi:hypothetical protein